MLFSDIKNNFFSETSSTLLFCGATREDRNEPFFWRRGDKTLSVFELFNRRRNVYLSMFNRRRNIKPDNDPENGLNCVLVYLKNKMNLVVDIALL